MFGTLTVNHIVRGLCLYALYRNVPYEISLKQTNQKVFFKEVFGCV